MSTIKQSNIECSDVEIRDVRDLVFGIGSNLDVERVDAEQVSVNLVYDKDGALQMSVTSIINLVIGYSAGYRIDSDLIGVVMLPSDCGVDIFNPKDPAKLIEAIEKSTLSIDPFGCHLGLEPDESHWVGAVVSDNPIVDRINDIREDCSQGIGVELNQILAELVNEKSLIAVKDVSEIAKKSLIDLIKSSVGAEAIQLP